MTRRIRFGTLLLLFTLCFVIGRRSGLGMPDPPENRQPGPSDNRTNPGGTSPAESLPPGMRAIALRVSTGSGACILPGHRVDVVCEIQGQQATVLVEDVLVRAITEFPEIVTLIVTPEQASKLARVRDNGKFWLAIRPFGEGEEEITPAPTAEKDG